MAYNILKGSVSNAISASGVDVGLTTSNTSNTASSSATLYATVAGTSAGDARVQYAVTGTTTWTQGLDNSVISPTADTFVLSQGTTLGTNNVMSVATSGEINYPLQPAFLATLGTTDSNVTGNGGVYTLGSGNALTEVFDQNSDFATSTFTAPVTGRYFLTSSMFVTGTTIATVFVLNINTSNRNYFNQIGRAAAAQNECPNLCIFADMDAADVSTATMTVTGEAGNTDDILGGATAATMFAGHLVC